MQDVYFTTINQWHMFLPSLLCTFTTINSALRTFTKKKSWIQKILVAYSHNILPGVWEAMFLHSPFLFTCNNKSSINQSPKPILGRSDDSLYITSAVFSQLSSPRSEESAVHALAWGCHYLCPGASRTRQTSDLREYLGGCYKGLPAVPRHIQGYVTSCAACLWVPGDPTTRGLNSCRGRGRWPAWRSADHPGHGGHLLDGECDITARHCSYLR